MKLQTGALVSSKGIKSGNVILESGDYLMRATKGIEVRESERNPGVLTHIVRLKIEAGPKLEDGADSVGRSWTRFLDINPELPYGDADNFRNDNNVDEFHDWLNAGGVKVSKTGSFDSEEIVDSLFRVRVGKNTYTVKNGPNAGEERTVNNIYKIEQGE